MENIETENMPKKASIYNMLLQFIHGALLTLAFHPFDIFLVIPIAFSGFLCCLEKECLAAFNKPLQQKAFGAIGFKHGFAFFLGHFISSFYWIVCPLFIDISKYWFLVPLAVLILPMFLAVFYAIASSIICSRILFKYVVESGVEKFKQNKIQRVKIAIYFAIGFLIAEIIRSHILLPFPWNLLGYASGYSLSLMQLASVTGVYGLSLLLYLVGIIPYTKNFIAISTVTIVVIIITLYGNRRLNMSYIDNNHRHKFVTLYVVQPNLQHHNYEYEKQLAALSKTISIFDTNNLQNAQDSTTQLIILPETAIPFILNKHQHIIFDDLMNKYNNNAFLISGIDRYDNNKNEYYNSMIMINNTGTIVDSYDKIILTPFGEYIPGYNILKNILQPIVGNAYGFTAGSNSRNLRIPLQHIFSEPLIIMPMICFESIFTPLTKPRSSEKVDLIVNLTNDSWFGKTIGPYQHFAMTRMRAIEYGLPVVRAAKSGISAVINSYGKIINQIQLNGEGMIVAEMPEDKVETIYMKIVQFFRGT